MMNAGRPMPSNNLARAPGAPQNVGGTNPRAPQPPQKPLPGHPQYQTMATAMGQVQPGGANTMNQVQHSAAIQPNMNRQQPTQQQPASPQPNPTGSPAPPPQTQPATQAASGANPFQPAYAPQAPVGQATLSAAQTSLTPEQLQALGPQATIDQILKGFQPQANLATSNLNNTLAASGIVGGGAQQAQNLLQSNLASALAPTLANAIQTSQGNVMGAEEFGLQGGLQQALANMGATNQMTGQNVSNAQQTNLFNTTAANNARSQLAQALQSGWQLPFEAFSQLESGGLSAAAPIASGATQNFAVPQQQSGGLLGALGI